MIVIIVLLDYRLQNHSHLASGRYMDGARTPWSMLFRNIEHSLAIGRSSAHDGGVKPVDDGRLKLSSWRIELPARTDN